MKAGWTTLKINCWNSLHGLKRSWSPVSKKKRVRRDIEKFHRSGRYWELIRLLESENAVSENAREHREAWQDLTKQAIRQSSAFERFCAEVGSIKKYPGDPDFRLLMLLKGFLENRKDAREILELKGLSAGAEKLRSNFGSFASESMQQETRLKDLLGKFIREPDKITRRYYEQLAEFLHGNPLSGNVSRLGQYIPSARRLNQKAALARGWNGFRMDTLKTLDRRMSSISKDLPPALQDIVLHPFICNFAALCRRLAQNTSSQQGAKFVHSIPFAFPRLAGERSAEIKNNLLPNLVEWSEDMDHGSFTTQEELKGLALEAKLSLLARLRTMGMEKRSHDALFDFPGFFNEEDDDELEQGEQVNTAILAKTLLMVHRSILGDISLRTPTLPSREKKELVRVMEPILCADLSFVLDGMEGSEEFVTFLGTILDSGCAGLRIGLLGLLAGAHYRDRDLLKRAEKLLDQASEPTNEDVKWLADGWIELYYPSARSLKPLLNRYADRRELLLVFTTYLCTEMEFELLESAARSQLPGFLANLFEELRPEKPKNPGILRRELAELNEYDVLDLARQFLGCYPEDRLTLEGHLCWLNSFYVFRPEGFWQYVTGDLRRFGNMREVNQDFPSTGMFRDVHNEKVKALLLFMNEHSDVLRTVAMDVLGPILDELLKHPQILIRQHRLLIHLNNLLIERLDAGEEAIRPLVDKIKKILLSLAKPAKSAPGTRKKRS
jgi:hypothetical protein